MQDDRTRPLRLHEAATRAFPDGSMTISGLRKERDRGRLAVFMIAGKEYTTLAAIDEMIERCRVPRKAPASTSKKERTVLPSGSSETDRNASALAALMSIGRKPKKPSDDTSPRSTSPSSRVVRLPLQTSS
jgi:hypothetical protein